MVRDGGISVWADTKIRSGARWKEEIEGALAMAKVVLLVSPHFLASDFIAEHELTPHFGAASKEGLVILWVYVSSCLYDETEIQHYQAAHDVAKPLDRLKPSERGDVLVAICRKIKAAANVVGPSPEAERGAARQQSALSRVRDGEQLQEHFFAIVNRIPINRRFIRSLGFKVPETLILIDIWFGIGHAGE
jgi:hypothetical protein